MTRGGILCLLCFVFTGLATFFPGCASQNASGGRATPNILWIYAEDLSPDLHCYGNDVIQTPRLDQLAAKGMRFTNAFTTAGVCTPSRTALATGMYQTSMGAHHMRYPEHLRPPLQPGVQTIFQLFRKNGYATANIKDFPGTGKTDWSFKANPSEHFDFSSWKELASQQKPFLAQLSIKNTHRPFSGKNTEGIDREKIQIPPYYPDHAVTRKDFANYYADIQELDRRIGVVLDSLEKFQLDQNTIIIFLGDHGRPMPRGKTWLYDSGIKIPLIVYIPEGLQMPENYQRGSVSDQLLSSIDLVATSLHLAGMEKPENVQGKIFLGKEREPERTFVYAAADRSGEIFFKSRCIRTKEFKYIRNYNHDLSVNAASTAYRRAHIPIYHLLNILHDMGSLNDHQEKLLQPLPYEELYDVVSDPFELNNLVGHDEYNDDHQQLSTLMDAYLMEIKDQGLSEDSDELKKVFEEYRVKSASTYGEKIEALRQQVLETVQRERPL